MKILTLDHVVFNVSDPERTLRFWSDTLGLSPERADLYRAGAAPFPSIRINQGTIVDFLPPEYHRVTNGQNVNHIALTFANPPAEIAAFLRERGVAIVREMTGNFGAAGDTAHSFHIYDPDGNMLELQSYE